MRIFLIVLLQIFFPSKISSIIDFWRIGSANKLCLFQDQWLTLPRPERARPTGSPPKVNEMVACTPRMDLFPLPEPTLFEPLQKELVIVPGYCRELETAPVVSAFCYAQANEFGDLVTLRFPGEKTNLTLVGNHPIVSIDLGGWHQGTATFRTYDNLAIAEYSDFVKSDYSADRESYLKTSYVCQLSVTSEVAKWRCEWLRKRNTSIDEVRVVFQGERRDETDKGTLSLSVTNTTGRRVSFPSELYELEKWLTPHHHLKKSRKDNVGWHGLTPTEHLQESTLEVWERMWRLKQILVRPCLENFKRIKKSVAITHENCTDPNARDNVSIFVK